MKTYIVNLEKDTIRREYVTELLRPYEWMDCTFVKAVYGKSLTPEELEDIFDLTMAYKRYGRTLNSGEIGCTASHDLIYRQLCESHDEWALVLEDDITILRELPNLDKIAETLSVDVPSVVFLSGDYWYTSLKSLDETLKLACVYDAVGTYAYLINRAAAELITKKNKRPSYVADNWSLFRRQGVRLFALYPYLIDANIEDLGSSIEQTYFGEVRKNMPLLFRIKSYTLSLKKKWLLRKGYFVSKIRK